MACMTYSVASEPSEMSVLLSEPLAGSQFGYVPKVGKAGAVTPRDG